MPVSFREVARAAGWTDPQTLVAFRRAQRGHTLLRIATDLGCHLGTVKGHDRAARDAIGVHSQEQLSDWVNDRLGRAT